MDLPVLSPPLLVVLMVPYCGNGRSACATLRVVCTAGFVKFAYGILIPAATACGELACMFSSATAPCGAEPRDQIVHDRQRHLIDVEQIGLQVRCPSIRCNRPRPSCPGAPRAASRSSTCRRSQAQRRVAVPVVDAEVVRERRIDLRRKRIRRHPLIEQERRRHAVVAVR